MNEIAQEWGITPGNCFYVDIELAKPTGDCDAPKNWPHGKWIADFLRGIEHPQFHFYERFGEGTVWLHMQTQQGSVDYLVVAHRPYGHKARSDFPAHQQSTGYMDGFEGIHFVDENGTLITGMPEHARQREELGVVVGELERKILAIRNEEGE
ncbi:hypothetical protein HYS48_02785 [Candidatus Woesearchaeota archaeon]|nr:hypothetical protein [Candidatus Woesearchaeota archaeon]